MFGEFLTKMGLKSHISRAEGTDNKEELVVMNVDSIYHVDENISVSQALDLIRRLNQEISNGETRMVELVERRNLLADITGVNSPIRLYMPGEESRMNQYERHLNDMRVLYPTVGEQIDALADTLHKIENLSELQESRRKLKSEIVEKFQLKDLIKE